MSSTGPASRRRRVLPPSTSRVRYGRMSTCGASEAFLRAHARPSSGVTRRLLAVRLVNFHAHGGSSAARSTITSPVRSRHSPSRHAAAWPHEVARGRRSGPRAQTRSGSSRFGCVPSDRAAGGERRRLPGAQPDGGACDAPELQPLVNFHVHGGSSAARSTREPMRPPGASIPWRHRRRLLRPSTSRAFYDKSLSSCSSGLWALAGIAQRFPQRP